nr:reverse transcriptase domain-containing protein [Tanacetum cinerariifolium]
EPPRSILTWEDLVSKFINEFFPPSRTTNLQNEISNFQQCFDESFHEAWDRYKDLLRACPRHGFIELHQLDTFYNALNPAGQDSLNSTASGNLLERRTQDVLTIIKNKSKVRNSRNKLIVSQVKSSDVNSSSSSDIAKLTHAVNQQTSDVTTAMTAILKQFQATPPLASDNIQGYVSATAVNYNQGELKAITIRSGLVLDGPFVHMPPSFIYSEEDERADETLTDPKLAEYTIKVPPPLVQKAKPPSLRNYVVH